MANKKQTNKKQTNNKQVASKKDVNKARAKRKKQKQEKKAGKVALLVFSLIVVAVAVFVITIKYINPSFDFSSLLPKSVVTIVNEKINESAPVETTETTTQVTTTEPIMDYIEFEDFDFNTSKQGNYLGNLLNGGKIGTDLTYIYYVVDGMGIYRLNPNTEAYALYYGSSDNLGSINLRGDYIYFVNEATSQLMKLQKGKKEAVPVADDVKLAYVYDNDVYFVTYSNYLYTMDVKALEPKALYYSADEQLDFVGISLSRVFFTVTQADGTVNYLTVDNKASEKQSHFRESTTLGEIMSMEIENGFMYYYQLQADGTYTLCRQKFGSQLVVPMVTNALTGQYAVVDSNRLYYPELDDNKLKMRELNMNSGDVKTLLKVSDVDTANLPVIQHGWEYDFIVGNGKYSASCVYTSSTNVMKLKDGNWSYK